MYISAENWITFEICFLELILQVFVWKHSSGEVPLTLGDDNNDILSLSLSSQLGRDSTYDDDSDYIVVGIVHCQCKHRFLTTEMKIVISVFQRTAFTIECNIRISIC